MLKRFFCICFIVITFCEVNAQSTSFYKEHITFKIEDGYFYVNGQYFLRNANHSNNQILLFYPFPTDTIYSVVDSLLIYNFNRGKEIFDYKKIRAGILFNLELDSITEVFISYRQRLKTNIARYILTTTQDWGKPLEEVTYELITTGNLKINSFSYPPDSQEIINNSIIYYWRKENFMPLKDMIFTFD
jgi:hypothetical protein